jgi:opacity protein-like surface antigen
MLRNVRIPQRIRLVPLLALWLALGVRVPTARAQDLGIWSMQLDGGVYTPLEARGPSPTAGMRYCKHVTSHLQVGMLTGWSFKRTRLEAPVTGPQGEESTVELARTDANLVPLMAFMQVDFTDRRMLVPFVGFGAGYEWLTLHAVDHQTGAQSKVDYGNLAWETYAGVGLRFAKIWRLNSEVYYNGASLENQVPNPDGSILREAVHVNGVGVRFGLDMEFQ